MNDSDRKSFLRTLSHRRDLTPEQRKSLSRPAHEEEGMAETCDELASTPILCHPYTVLVEEVEKIVSKARPRKKGQVGGKCFNI